MPRVVCSCSTEEAAQLAETGKGWGPSMWTRTREGWEELLGEGYGRAMFSTISPHWYKKEAVPWSLVSDL